MRYPGPSPKKLGIKNYLFEYAILVYISSFFIWAARKYPNLSYELKILYLIPIIGL